MKTWATMEAINVCCEAQKCAYLERKSQKPMVPIKTWIRKENLVPKMTNLLMDFKRSTINFMEMKFLIVVGVNSGCNVKGVFTISPLFY